jgi:hypothetical protein
VAGEHVGETLRFGLENARRRCEAVHVADVVAHVDGRFVRQFDLAARAPFFLQRGLEELRVLGEEVFVDGHALLFRADYESNHFVGGIYARWREGDR